MTKEHSKTSEEAALWRRARASLRQEGWSPVHDDAAPDPLLLAAYLDGGLAEAEVARLEARLAGDPALLDELLALRETLAAGPETAPAGMVARAQALREAQPAPRPVRQPAAGPAAARGRSLAEWLFGFSLRPAVPALAALVLLLACAGAFELGRYQAERLDSTQAVDAGEGDLPVDLLLAGIL